jgi:hypothetical protein
VFGAAAADFSSKGKPYMASVKKGFLAASREWARHLRPYWRRQFWKQERRGGRKEARKQLGDSNSDASAVVAATTASDAGCSSSDSGSSGGGDC